MDCNCLIHPFQNDPGTSQRQRVMNELLDGAPQIDGRTLADLLHYFVELSSHINYYDADLNVSDWQPFFKKSIPFTIASIINYKTDAIKSNFEFYNSLFEKRPSSTGLQLNAYFLYYRFINTINTWYLAIKDSGLPLAAFMENIIRTKLRQPLRLFISYANAAVISFGMKRIEFAKLVENSVWGLDPNTLVKADTNFSQGTSSKYKQINTLFSEFKSLLPVFLEAIRVMALEGVPNLEKSFIPVKEELKKYHPPHLALLFAFLNMFRELQNDLNRYTRKHLDFFYKKILQFKTEGARPDKAHIVFEIQKQLKTYLVKKGIRVKDGKDEKKQEILFGLDDEIVVNKAQVKDTRTLYLNNQYLPDPNTGGQEITVTEGVYMAIDATKADGVDKEFQTDVKNFYTVGNKDSKYVIPGTNKFKPYPNARLGFILASQVLYLNEGRRTVNIALACQLSDPTVTTDTPVCESGDENGAYPTQFSMTQLFSKVKKEFSKYYVYISEDLLQAALKKGISEVTVDSLRDLFLLEEMKTVCNKPENIYRLEDSIEWGVWWSKYYKNFSNPAYQYLNEKEIIDVLFARRRVFKLSFSGEKAWIEPSYVSRMRFSRLVDNGGKKTFAIKIKAVLKEDKDPVTFFDKDKLKEDYNTTLPLVKIELDDKIKVKRGFPIPKKGCCLQIPPDPSKIDFSFYYFLRNLTIIEKTDADLFTPFYETNIRVKVCGLKKFIVQNDESVMDVNGPIYPFGTRPNVPDFSVLNPIPVTPNLVGPNFYIGSNEVLRKKWDDIMINIEWKDKPSSFNEYYKAYFVNPLDHTKFGLNETDFLINLSVLEEGTWKGELLHPPPTPVTVSTTPFHGFNDRPLFRPDNALGKCGPIAGTVQSIYLKNLFFNLDQEFTVRNEVLQKLDVSTFDGFIKVNLQGQDFLHKEYAFILARQMVAFGKLPNEHVDDAIYYDTINPAAGPFVISTQAILTALGNIGNIAKTAHTDVNSVDADAFFSTLPPPALPADIVSPLSDDIRSILRDPNTPGPGDLSLDAGAAQIDLVLNGDGTPANPGVINLLNAQKTFAAIIPNAPWTPTISHMTIDYSATAKLEDIDLIHLYPYPGTYKEEEIELKPTLFPTFCDEGTIFIGLENLVPGNNLNILFQLAEATSDSELEKEDVHWHYLDTNVWKPLRTGFEVVNDATKNLTTSGIVKFSLPENMTNDNTVLPKNLHWIKGTIPQNSRAISETTAILTQAILAVFTNDDANDKLRLSKALPAGSISKLNEADASIKTVSQPFDAFDGLIPEEEGPFYIRVSETLRHKGRAIQAFDYERITLQEFPKLFKAKCINHSFFLNAHEFFNDFPYAPGYVILAVIPDLTKLKAGNSYEPKVPVSMLEEIDSFIRKRISPFVRFRSANPRYEKVNFSLHVQLLKGKDPVYYKEKIKQDIRELLAPWAIGKYDKLSFGQCVYRSDIIHLLEASDYVDFITDLQMGKEGEAIGILPKVCPTTPRSILVAGEIDVCLDQTCPAWGSYESCDGKLVDACDNKPIPISKYCKERRKITQDLYGR